MPSAKPLNIETAFGPSLRETLLLASHPDESHDAQGGPRPDRRTLVLKLDGKRAVYHEQLSKPLSRSWYSASGVAYCSAGTNRSIYKYAAGRWTEEAFSDAPGDFISSVFAVPGQTPESDTVFLARQNQIFIRQGGSWQSKRAPGDAAPWQMDGTRGDQVYIGASTLSMWNGTELVELEGPRGGAQCLVLGADDRIIAGAVRVNVSTKDGGWQRIDTPVERFCQFARLGQDVYALSTRRGVCRVYPGEPTVVTRKLEATGIVSVGDGLIAYGEDGCLAFDGKEWFEVDIPTCVAGSVPTTV